MRVGSNDTGARSYDLELFGEGLEVSGGGRILWALVRDGDLVASQVVDTGSDGVFGAYASRMLLAGQRHTLVLLLESTQDVGVDAFACDGGDLAWTMELGVARRSLRVDITTPVESDPFAGGIGAAAGLRVKITPELAIDVQLGARVPLPRLGLYFEGADGTSTRLFRQANLAPVASLAAVWTKR